MPPQKTSLRAEKFHQIIDTHLSYYRGITPLSLSLSFLCIHTHTHTYCLTDRLPVVMLYIHAFVGVDTTRCHFPSRICQHMIFFSLPLCLLLRPARGESERRLTFGSRVVVSHLSHQEITALPPARSGTHTQRQLSHDPAAISMLYRESLLANYTALPLP